MLMKETILDKMKKAHLTPTTLSQKSGVGVSTLQNILYGRSQNPTIQILTALANAFDCPVSDLVEGENEKNPFRDFWNQTLYIACTRSILDHLSASGKDLSHSDIQRLIGYAYEFSLENKSSTADDRFCKWLVRKKLEA